jgi:drug/metabolite transporter (DMT)-like permease
VTLSVTRSVTASAIQKRLLNGGAGSRHLWVATYALALGPAIAATLAMWRGVADGFWTTAIIAGILDAFGNLAMVAALRTADLSVFGPLNAIRPLLALIFGWMFLGEVPNNTGLIGIAVTVFGAYFLLREDSGAPSKARVKDALGVLGFRMLGIVLSIAASVFLKRAALLGSAEATIAVWDVSGLVCLFAFQFVERGHAIGKREDRSLLFVHACVFFIMQWITVRIFQTTLLAYSFAFFQLGMVLQVFVGKFFFNEPHFVRRLVACIVMTLGSLLILFKG